MLVRVAYSKIHYFRAAFTRMWMNHSPKFDEAPRKLTPDRCSIPAEVASMIIKKCYTRHSNDEECSDTPSSPGRPKYFCYLGRSPDRARTK
ncbi:hypothetical protein M8J76_016879 [Diaphorina citri]|nr:hypothetical protein M8J75_005553 [Diaphorina citri]KAI5727243.1 hypothetical protein M8J76_016879 [Diaphorina citri]